VFGHFIAAAWEVIAEVVGPRRRILHQRRHNPAGDIIDMDTAEHLPRQVDPPRFAFLHPVERRAPRPVDPRQPEHPRAHAEPREVSLRPRIAAAFPALRDGRRRLVDPRPRAVAIDAGGGKVEQRLARQGLAIMIQHRIAPGALGRDGGEDVARLGNRRQHRSAVGKGDIARAPGRAHLPPARAHPRRDPPRRVAQSEDQQIPHALNLKIGRRGEST
jgi:hypothetical protein